MYIVIARGTTLYTSDDLEAARAYRRRWNRARNTMAARVTTADGSPLPE